MKNPYEILGINENASEAEIKAAYKEMVKKYHPDKYQNNPLADLAEDKLREVNEAYDQLMKNGKNSVNGSSGYDSGNSRFEFQKIRKNIDAGRLQEAERDLNNIKVRNAEWIFLSGVISYKKGWYDDAVSKIQQAANMDPGNMEYQNVLRGISNSADGYRSASMGRGYRSNDDLLCSACQCYICADCCCNCI